MLVIGYVLQDLSSAQQKFHATIVTATGYSATFWGGTYNKTSDPAKWRGQIKADQLALSVAVRRLRTVWEDKSRTYKDVPAEVGFTEVPDGLTGWDLYEAFCADEANQHTSRVTGSPGDTLLMFTTSVEQRAAAARAARAEQSTAKPVADRDKKLRLPAGESVIRPNGQTYLPRDLGGHTDVAVLRRSREAFLPALLSGRAGTGKTAVADGAFPDLILVSCHGDMSVDDLVGKYLPGPDGTGWVYVDGPLSQAMKEGRPLCLDEINRMPAEVCAVLHAATDGRGVLRVDARPDLPLVQAAPGFYVIAMYNPDDLGSAGLSEAILSRFPLQIEVTTDYDAASTLGVPIKLVTFARNLAKTSVERVAAGEPPVWAPEMRELLAAKAMIDAGLGEEFAMTALVGRCPHPEDLPLVQEKARLAGFPAATRLVTGARV